MSIKYKPTGCARFFLFMIIAAPLAWVGASYYNGEDPLQNLKSLFSKEQTSSSSKEKSIKDLEQEIMDLEDRLRRCEKALRER